MKFARGKALGSAAMEQLLTVDDAERLAEASLARGLELHRRRCGRRAHAALEPRGLLELPASYRVSRRCLRVSTETTVLGTPVSMPVLVAPMAFQQVAHEEAELATARGTAAAGTLMCLSTVATSTPAEVAAAAPGARAGSRSTSSAIAR